MQRTSSVQFNMISVIFMFLSCFLIWWLSKKINDYIILRRIPSPPGKLLFGHVHLLIGGYRYLNELIKVLQTQYKGIVTLWFAYKPYLVIYNAEDMEVILKSFKNFPKGKKYDNLKPWLGESILISNGDKFWEHKKIIVRSFHMRQLLMFLPIFNSNARDMVKRFSQYIGKGEFAADKDIAVGAMFNLLSTTLGLYKELITEEEAFLYLEAIEKIGQYVFEREIKFWLQNDLVFHFSKLKQEQNKVLMILHKLTEKVIREKYIEYHRRKKIGELESNRPEVLLENFFSNIKQNGEHFTEKEIKDEAMTMMFAGQDTTSITLGFVLSLLGIYQNIQDKVYTELVQIFGHSDRDVEYGDILKMTYLEQVIQETWRLFPPISTISRTPVKNFKLGDFVVPKGTTMLCSIFMLHRNPAYYPRPNKFNPDNFLPKNIKQRHPYSFIPFSYGTRKCIGAKYAMLVTKVFLSTILRNYKVKCNQQLKDFKLKLQLNIRRKEGFLIEIEER